MFSVVLTNPIWDHISNIIYSYIKVSEYIKMLNFYEKSGIFVYEFIGCNMFLASKIGLLIFYINYKPIH